MSKEPVPANGAALEGCRRIVEAYFLGGHLLEGVSVVHRRSRERGVLLRTEIEGGRKVVIKAWSHRTSFERFKCFAGMSNARREWQMHRHLHAAGLSMPEPLGYSQWSGGGRTYEMTVVQDLGKLVSSMICLKRSIGESDEGEVRRIENTIIAMTASMINARISDVDHQLHNIVMAADGRLVRLDVECAVHWRFRSVPESGVGATLGRMVSSHAFACQPDLARTEQFAKRLADAVSATPGALRHAKTHIDKAMRLQRSLTGVDSQLSLAW